MVLKKGNTAKMNLNKRNTKAVNTQFQGKCKQVHVCRYLVKNGPLFPCKNMMLGSGKIITENLVYLLILSTGLNP